MHDGADADWSPDGRKLAFVGADARMCTMNADGSDVTPLQPR